MKCNLSVFYLIFWFTMLTYSSCSQNNLDFPASDIELNFEPVNEDFDNPWSFVFLPDRSILVTEKEGELFHLVNGVKNPDPVSGLPDVYVRGQGGLMDLELHPDYEHNGWLYLSYGSSPDGKSGGNTTIMRARFTNNSLSDQQVIFQAEPNSRRGQHWGGRLEFDRKGYLYISVGDRGARDENPQSLTNHSGKIHRVYDDGSIPGDNPFVAVEGAIGSIYSYGHRNPQGMAIHPQTGEIWIHEHGPRGGDELNRIQKGVNYGWPVITYGINYSGTEITDITAKEGMEQPVYYWVPSIAPCGMTFVTSDLYPEWKGSVLIGSLKFNYIHRCELDGNKVVRHEKIAENLGRIRTVREGPDGYLYASVEGKGLFKLVP